MINWRKSSHSDMQGQECVEVAELTGAIGIRDSEAPEADQITLPTTGFTALVARIKQDELEL
ncbi:DUF397 domain-containing protein [Actinomadura macrotermitis]|uniref:DUF397 domain-containing protein n=1 Tax=Actinomadura macrotermitis TaxID=2585200 RepID=A0A7K0C1E8_9ACTN|nr:DUF397 domain-containing protein [Actinomadura macrotermitis]MQY07288.1 hypothetical protein [Actinomadura macrotermitis]